ncbi:MFS transporter [Streptomyces olivaceoviridis]|uniref:MFS transporter n=1 Tax=Streptomyces olivaceoviridis TaxID=1921 RepID=UPI00367F5C47
MSAAGFPAPALTAVAPRALPARSLVVAGVSTVVEWYDFALCLYLTTIMARVLYGGDGTSVLTTLAVFGIAYVMRPLGAVCFGRLGDRLGRRRVMLTSMTVMAVAMWVTAALPTDARIGATAGVLLLMLRCVMGFSVGGEYSSVLTYLVEGAKPARRGLMPPLASAGSEIGALPAVGTAAVTTSIVSGPAMDSWGWRLPYVLGALLATATPLARHSMEESPELEQRARTDDHEGTVEVTGLGRLLRTGWKPISRAFLISAVGSITYYGGVFLGWCEGGRGGRDGRRGRGSGPAQPVARRPTPVAPHRRQPGGGAGTEVAGAPMLSSRC